MKPNGYVGSNIYLDNWGVFDGQEWEEWRFGFEIVDENDNPVDWDVLAGIAFMNNEGQVIYDFAV